MSTPTDAEDQDYLVEILTQASDDLKLVLEDLTTDFQERFGPDASPLYLHIQLLAQHLGQAIAQGPADMREQLQSEAREQENLVLTHWDEPEEHDLLTMKAQGNA